MHCRVYSLKITANKLSKVSRNHLSRLFTEAKWFYNYCLTDIQAADTTRTSVPVKTQTGIEERQLTVLSGQMRQDIKQRIFASFKTLKALKAKGHKVGRLKYKKFVNAVPLRQYGNTFQIDFARKRIKLQKLKPWLKVHGLSQLPKDAEITNAVLVRKPDGYYVHVTTFTEPEAKEMPNVAIGIDFGCETQLTLSNGIKIKFQVPPSKRLRRLDRRIGKLYRKPSKRRRKYEAQRRKEYQRLTNKRNEIRQKIVSAIVNTYSVVVVQDENIRGWKAAGHGKKVQFSGIDGILRDLKNKARTPVVVDRFFASTQTCPVCCAKTKHERHQRTFCCSGCGHTADRDVNAAVAIKTEGLNTLPTGCRKTMLAEASVSTLLLTLNAIHGVVAMQAEPLKREAPAFEQR